MKFVEGEIYYFLKDDYSRWGKVYECDDTHVYCLVSQDKRDIENIPVNKKSDFLEEVLISKTTGAHNCRLVDAADTLGYGSDEEMQNQIDVDWNGDRRSFFLYGHNLRITKAVKEVKRPECTISLCNFRTDWIEINSMDHIIHVDDIYDKYKYLMILDRISIPPRGKANKRHFSLDMILK
jgi:hypothetical protein